MGKFIKIGRVGVVLQGRQAGKKCIVIKTFDDGSKSRPYPHCLVAGVEKAPLKITKKMNKKVQKRRMRVKPFLKYVNYKHMMPTRYMVPHEIDPRKIVTDSQMDSSEGRKTAKKSLKAMLKQKFVYPPLDKNGKTSKDFLFLKSKLRF